MICEDVVCRPCAYGARSMSLSRSLLLNVYIWVCVSQDKIKRRDGSLHNDGFEFGKGDKRARALFK